LVVIFFNVRMEKHEIFTNSPAATLALGKRVGERLSAGSVIALIGELGCGKTLFTRGICDGLGVPVRQVNSPTFMLVNEYRGRLPVFHIDLYRLSGVNDSFEIGIADYLSRAVTGVMIIEWAEKILAVLPADLLKVEFDIISEKKRRIVFSFPSAKFAYLLKELKSK
jgi:tRNA threonylcarbamoyladenosine biosynthesis protein TsaE